MNETRKSTLTSRCDNDALAMVYRAFDTCVACLPPPAYMSPEIMPFFNFTTILSEIVLIFVKNVNFMNILLNIIRDAIPRILRYYKPMLGEIFLKLPKN